MIDQNQQPDLFSFIAENVKNELAELQTLKDAHFSETRTWFLCGVGAAAVGFLVIITGSIVAIIGLTGGWTATLAGVIPTAASALFFQQKRSADNLVDKDMQRIGRLRDEERQFQLVLKSDDKELIQQFVRHYFEQASGQV